MLKNKIYNYLSVEIFKNFTIILLTFSAIAWTVRAVNFLDLMIEDGYSAIIYFKYSLLSFSTIVTRFVPLSFLLALIISIAKFERQQELLILWTMGLNKIKVVNIFFLVGFLIALFQILLGLIINPFSLNKSRALLRETQTTQINSILKVNDFSDTFKGVTFYIDEKNLKDELINIFIKDVNGSLYTIVNEFEKSNITTIY
jgi:lipopolysaccharide export system permease protein